MLRTYFTTLWPLWNSEVFGNQLAVLAETFSYLVDFYGWLWHQGRTKFIKNKRIFRAFKTIFYLPGRCLGELYDHLRLERREILQHVVFYPSAIGQWSYCACFEDDKIIILEYYCRCLWSVQCIAPQFILLYPLRTVSKSMTDPSNSSTYIWKYKSSVHQRINCANQKDE